MKNIAIVVLVLILLAGGVYLYQQKSTQIVPTSAPVTAPDNSFRTLPAEMVGNTEFKIISPKSSERIRIGDKYTIEWESNNIGDVLISVYPDPVGKVQFQTKVADVGAFVFNPGAALSGVGKYSLHLGRENETPSRVNFELVN